MRLYLQLIIVLTFSSTAIANTQSKAVEELVRNSQQAFESGDIQSQKAAVATLFPAKNQFIKIFGPKSVDLYTLIETYKSRMIEHVEQVAKEFTGKGALLTVKVIPITAGDGPEYNALLEIVPPDIGVYRIMRTYEKGGGGSSTYFVLNDGACVWVRGAETLPQEIKKIGAK